MATWDEILERNRKYAETSHIPRPYISEFSSPPPIPTSLIFSCIDFRVSVEEFLGIKREEATIILNAGARVNKSITDLLFLDNFTRGQIKDVIVIHHTDCGFTHFTDESVKSDLKALHPPHLAKEIDSLYFGTFGSSDFLEESVREDLKFLKDHHLVRQELKDNAKGYVYDIKTGKLGPILLMGEAKC